MLTLTRKTVDVRQDVGDIPLIWTLRVVSDFEAQADLMASLSSPYMDVMDAISKIGAAEDAAAMRAAREAAKAAMAATPSWKEDMIEDMRRKSQNLAGMVVAIHHAETREDVEFPEADDYERTPFGLEFLRSILAGYAAEVGSLRGKSSTPSTPTPTTPARRKTSAGTGRPNARPRKGAG
jgi:hypothetical protein